MNLQEYLTQKDPVFKPNVILEDDEFSIMAHDLRGELINIDEVSMKYGHIAYFRFYHSTSLFTTDHDGNPLKISVFSTKSFSKPKSLSLNLNLNP